MRCITYLLFLLTLSPRHQQSITSTFASPPSPHRFSCSFCLLHRTINTTLIDSDGDSIGLTDTATGSGKAATAASSAA
ncbi:hypothetical protein J3F84DRAFT_366664 [Trichoderma pleuroticola]